MMENSKSKKGYAHEVIEMRSQAIKSKLKILKEWDKALTGDLLEEACNELDIIITKHFARIDEIIDEALGLKIRDDYGNNEEY